MPPTQAGISHDCKRSGSKTKFAESKQQISCGGVPITRTKDEFKAKIAQLIGLNMEKYHRQDRILRFL